MPAETLCSLLDLHRSQKVSGEKPRAFEPPLVLRHFTGLPQFTPLRAHPSPCHILGRVSVLLKLGRKCHSLSVFGYETVSNTQLRTGKRN